MVIWVLLKNKLELINDNLDYFYLIVKKFYLNIFILDNNIF